MEQKRIHRLKQAVLIFRGTSDDLFFWTLIDTLFLTVAKGLTGTEVSLVFAVSFWVALLFKRFGYESIKRMKIGKSLVFSAVLFLAAAALITFGATLPVIIIGQCMYAIAPDFYDVSDILLKELCVRDKEGKDYVESDTLATTMYSVITLGTALLIDPLMRVNPYLPMILCVVTRSFSLVLAISIYIRAKDVNGLTQGRASILKCRFVSRSTVSYLFMAALFGAFCSIAMPYLKLLLQDNLAVVYDERSVIELFSYCIIATRVAKILGNITIGRSKKRGADYPLLSVCFCSSGILAASCGLAGVMLVSMPAIVVTVVGLLIVYHIFDPMMIITSFLDIENLNHDQAITAIYKKGLLEKLADAIISTLITVCMASNSYAGVMILLILLAVGALFFGMAGMRYHNLRSRDYIKTWPRESVESVDSLMVAAAMLMLHYGAVQSYKFNPAMLEERVGRVENIGLFYRRFGYVERRPYTFEDQYQAFCDGYPSAVYGSLGGEYKWYPVFYVDEDDGVTVGDDNEPLFLGDFEDIREQCVFTLRPRQRARNRLGRDTAQ